MKKSIQMVIALTLSAALGYAIAQSGGETGGQAGGKAGGGKMERPKSAAKTDVKSNAQIKPSGEVKGSDTQFKGGNIEKNAPAAK